MWQHPLAEMVGPLNSAPHALAQPLQLRQPSWRPAHTHTALAATSHQASQAHAPHGPAAQAHLLRPGLQAGNVLARQLRLQRCQLVRLGLGGRQLLRRLGVQRLPVRELLRMPRMRDGKPPTRSPHVHPPSYGRRREQPRGAACHVHIAMWHDDDRDRRPTCTLHTRRRYRPATALANCHVH